MKPDLLEFDESSEAAICSGWPQREVRPPNFPVRHAHEDLPEARTITVQQVVRLATDVAQMRAQFSKALTKIEQQLSHHRGPRLASRGGRLPRRSAGQTALPLVPKELSPILDAIENSKAIVNCQPDPSDDLPLACSHETWQRATRILIDHALAVWVKIKVVIRAPTISAGPEGSVDLYWTSAPYGLLINIPPDPKQPATFFGDDATNPDATRTSGMLEPAKPIDVGILMWLAHTADQ
jgi:hypothetical protein